MWHEGNRSKAQTMEEEIKTVDEKYYIMVLLELIPPIPQVPVRGTSEMGVLRGGWGHMEETSQCRYKTNIYICLHNDRCYKKALSITYSGCVPVALVIQHTKCMCHILLSAVDCMANIYFHIIS